ncbi:MULTISPECIES: L,D-transpeptidase family protein [Sphingomonas]|jgi:murein L,D-transpeptidase YcbB/YkuD|uniref:L,D-transpeptidase family protein n=1 Tax=Sphingomonas TaxID=13687 RepID=UPI000DBC2CC9|nr:L,D-transpeptidase family protein [Sphingomonas sp.]PZU77085.1 MAG: murein L,D-transpeptidase [Sphingomonas sp.]HEX2019837.1 L,D-transpeptidase family protein [Aurantimonas sp.]
MTKPGLFASSAFLILASLSAASAASPISSPSAAADAESLWSSQNREALRDALAARARHGLDHLQFPVPDGSPTSLDKAALGYAHALADGVVDPTSLHAIYTVPRPTDRQLAAELHRALQENRLAAWLNGLAPQDAAYHALSDAYMAANDRRGVGRSEMLESAEPLRIGDESKAVVPIAAQLHAEGYLDQPYAGSTYNPALADAVTRLQRDYGIAADGIVGPDTLAVLNLGPGDHARALAVALERRRWLSRNPPLTRIDVNTAAATLRYYRDGALVDERKVIVGEPGKETPALSSPIYRLVANPTWTIPKSIQHGELAGVSRRYLRAHNMFRRGGWIVQRSGRGNALGLVKFDMHNQHAIYLHDTSSRHLFERSQRHLSHGCVRVADALGFAEMLAEQEGVASEWQRARDTGRQRFVALPREIPVRMLYHNVFVASEGQVAYRTDPYGWNAPIAAALGFSGKGASVAKPEAIDVGP